MPVWGTFGEVLVPEERVIEIKDGKRKETFRKLYVSYLFVQMEFSDEAWHVIKGPRTSSASSVATSVAPQQFPRATWTKSCRA